MFYQPLLYALLAQVSLTFLVWVYLYSTRLGKIFRDDIDVQKLGNRSEAQALLAEVAGPSENFKNLFEKTSSVAAYSPFNGHSIEEFEWSFFSDDNEQAIYIVATDNEKRRARHHIP